MMRTARHPQGKEFVARWALAMVVLPCALAIAPPNVRAESPPKGVGRLAGALDLGAISGTVVSATDSLAIQDAFAIVLGRNLGARTGLDGQFRIDGVPPGVQMLRVMRVGFKRVDREVTVSAQESAIGTIAIETEAVRVSVIECPGIAQRSAGPDTLGVIFGTVVAAKDGLPIQYASVIVLGRRLGMPTNRAGQFRIDRVPLGTQTLRVMIVGHKRVDRKITVLPGENSLGTIALEFEAVRMSDDSFSRESIRRDGAVGSAARTVSGDLHCVVRLIDPEPTVGDGVEIDAKIYNLSRFEAVLPFGRKGSDAAQFPRVLVQIHGPPGGFVVEREKDAGDAKGLRMKDLATVKPGNSFDPLMTGWKPANLRYGKFKKPGKYRLVFQYSTFESDGNRWLGDTRFTEPVTVLAKRLMYVPLVQLADSVSFVVRE
jgi:hypothetical protein